MTISIKAKQTSIIMSRSKKNKSRAIIQRHSCCRFDIGDLSFYDFFIL